MALDRHALAHVVEQQRKVEEFRVFDAVENVHEFAARFAGAAESLWRFSIVTSECSSTVYRW